MIVQDMAKNKEKVLSKLELPPIIFGTSSLGNLFVSLDDHTKKNIVVECIRQSGKPVVFDTAGKYGAGLALQMLGSFLTQLHIQPEDIIISNKLGWLRTPLVTEEPTFEPGVWKDLAHDAIQKISYTGILECFEQGNTLLQGYIPQWVSVHDPDEYLANAKDAQQEAQRYQDILGAYRALFELKDQGKVKAVGVGAKNWKVIQKIAQDIPLDWVMIANSMTIKSHPRELQTFLLELEAKGVFVINSAVFHSGFLTGGSHYDYVLVRKDSDPALFEWRSKFFALCQQFGISPAAACVQFALQIPGVKTVALNTSHPARVKDNVALASAEIPLSFWTAMKEEGLL